MRATVVLDEVTYKEAMIKAANQGIFTFSELVRQLLHHYTVGEAKQRMNQK